MGVIIKKVVNNSELKQFIRFPHTLYASSAYWVPPLISDEMAILSKNKNPAFDYCEASFWMAYKDGKAAGRIVGIISNSYIAKWGRKYGRFGWFDFIDDEEVSEALLGTVESWAKSKNTEAIHGPMGFTDFDPEGMLIEGFDSTATMTTLYNYPYYPCHLEKLGYKKDVDWVEYEISIPSIVSERITTTAQWVAGKFNLRALDAKSSRELLPYVQGVFDVINASYASLYGVVTLTNAQIDFYTRQFFSFINPDYVSLILRNDTVVAFAIAMPSLSVALQKANGRLFPFGFFHLYRALHTYGLADLYMIAIHPTLQGKGVNTMIIKDLQGKFIKNHVVKAITHPMLEGNGKMLSFWKNFETSVIKRRRCYIKLLNERNTEPARSIPQ